MNPPPREPDDWDSQNQWNRRSTISSDALVERIDGVRADIQRLEGGVREDIKRLEGKVDAMDNDVAGTYVTRDEFKPVMMITYGFAAAILLGFIGLVIHTVGWHP